MSMQATDIGPSHSGPSQTTRHRTGRLDHAIPVAMLIVATAMGVVGHLHLGLQPEFAAAVGLSLFCLMLVCHVLLRAADDADRAAEDAAEQRIKQVSSPIPAPAMPPAPPVPHAPVRPPVAPTDKTAADRVAAPLVREPLPRELQAGPASATAESKALPDRSTAPAGWTFRPVDIQLPEGTQAGGPAFGIQPPALSAMGPSIADDVPPPADGRAPLSAQSERIDAILKRLAVQIRSGTQLQAPAPEAAEVPVIENVEPVLPIATAPPPIPAPTPAMTPAIAAPGLTVVAPPLELPEAALSSAVDALRLTVEAMRASPVLANAPSPSPAEVRLAAVADALAAERANVFLEPILALSEDQARHFEVSVRLVSDAGEDLDARAITMRAGGTGLLAVLDALGLRHAAGFALKLERRGREGTVFSTVAGQSLESDTFVSDAAGRHAQGIANRLVLTFAQHEMRGLGPAQIAALGELGQLGFRFALSSVADLDMDFEALRSLGFEFVKLDASVFLQGVHCAGAEIPAVDICGHFEDLGLQVIVSGIDDATLRQRVEGCGVTFGQGLLFGEPRPIPVGTTSGSIAA